MGKFRFLTLHNIVVLVISYLRVSKLKYILYCESYISMFIHITYLPYATFLCNSSLYPLQLVYPGKLFFFSLLHTMCVPQVWVHLCAAVLLVTSVCQRQRVNVYMIIIVIIITSSYSISVLLDLFLHFDLKLSHSSFPSSHDCQCHC